MVRVKDKKARARRKPGADSSGAEGAGLSYEKSLNELYAQAQAVKIWNFNRLLKAEKRPEAGAEGELIRLSQMVLKAIELQLRIAGESLGEGGTEAVPLAAAEVWEILLADPEVGALFRRDRVQKRLLAELKRRSRDADAGGRESPAA